MAHPRRLAARRLPGSAPGTLSPVGGVQPRLTLTVYGAAELNIQSLTDPEAAAAVQGRPDGMLWLDVAGLGDAGVVQRVGERFGLHPLALEDVLHVPQRPKVESYAEVLFLVLQRVHDVPGDAGGAAFEQVSLFLGPNFVVTFREQPDDLLEPLYARLRRPGSRIRQSGADYLFYAVIDLVVDHGFPLLERYGERIDRLEDALAGRARPEHLRAIHALRREMLEVRRAVWPLRDVVNALLRDDSDAIDDAVRVYLRDVADHVMQLLDGLETYRELSSGLLDLYVSSVSNQMNEVMKVLTLISTVFIPLTFITGVYGMNFRDIPEVRLPWGYPAVLALMAAVTLFQFLYFRARGWIGSGSRR